jgi:hypothetical protein
MEQQVDDPDFFRHYGETLDDEHTELLVAMSEQCLMLEDALERAIGGDVDVQETVDAYGHVLDLLVSADSDDRPLLIGTPAEATLLSTLIRTTPRLSPLTSEEREFVHRSYSSNVHLASRLEETKAGLQDNGVFLADSGPVILSRWGRWLRGADVGGAPPPSHLALTARLLAVLIRDGLTHR